MSKQLLSNFQADNICDSKQLQAKVKNGVANKRRRIDQEVYVWFISNFFLTVIYMALRFKLVLRDLCILYMYTYISNVVYCSDFLTVTYINLSLWLKSSESSKIYTMGPLVMCLAGFSNSHSPMVRNVAFCWGIVGL